MALVDDYNKALNQIDREYTRIESAALSDLASTTRQAVRDVAAVVADSDTSQPNAILQSAINRIITRYQQSVTGRIRQLFEQVSELGADSVTEPLAAIDEPTQRADTSQLLEVVFGSASIVGAGIGDTMRQAINTQLRLNFLGNFSSAKLMSNIRQSIRGKLNGIRTAVRSEAARAYNMAHLLQAKAANRLSRDSLLKDWITKGDKRVRDTHRTAGRAKPIPVNQLFIVGSDKLRFPGDPRGSAKEVINCRCRMKIIHPKVLKNAKQAA